VVFLDGMRSINRHLVGGGIAVLNAQVVVVQRHVHIGQDQLVLDPLPYDAGHFVPVDLHHGLGHLDLLHVR
jgi:hypothetical protein